MNQGWAVGHLTAADTPCGGRSRHDDRVCPGPGTRAHPLPLNRMRRIPGPRFRRPYGPGAQRCSDRAQSAGTRPAGPGAGWSAGWLSGGASSGPDSYNSSLS